MYKIPKNKAENKTPIGLLAPSKATAIPSNPCVGITPICMLVAFPVYWTTPASPAKAPAIIIDNTMFLFTEIPAYSAASLLNPTAFNSYPKTVLFSINQIANTETSAINIPMFINDPWKKSVSACILKVAVAGSCADSVSKNSPLKYIGTI